MPALSLQEELALAVATMLGALLSLIGSLTIVISIIRRNKYRRSTYHRLLLGLSSFDILSSLGWLAAPFVSPSSTNRHLSIGTMRTCELDGFLMQSASSVVLYHGCLSIYFLLTIQSKQKNYYLKWRETLMHFICIGFNLIAATWGVAEGIFNAFDVGEGCWVSPYPQNCSTNPEVECTRATNANVYGYIFGVIPAITSLFIVAVCNIRIYLHAKSLERLNERYDHRCSSHLNDPSEDLHLTTGIVRAGCHQENSNISGNILPPLMQNIETASPSTLHHKDEKQRAIEKKPQITIMRPLHHPRHQLEKEAKKLSMMTQKKNPTPSDPSLLSNEQIASATNILPLCDLENNGTIQNDKKYKDDLIIENEDYTTTLIDIDDCKSQESNEDGKEKQKIIERINSHESLFSARSASSTTNSREMTLPVLEGGRRGRRVLSLRREHCDQQEKVRKSQQIAIQATYYFVVFASTMICQMILRQLDGSDIIVEQNESDWLPLILLSQFFSASAGAANLCIYVRPRYIRIRERQPTLNKLVAFWEAISFKEKAAGSRTTRR